MTSTEQMHYTQFSSVDSPQSAIKHVQCIHKSWIVSFSF